ncbi:hypothetical protein, partial [Anaerotruncus massiliensis (ex Togo et al. 2019)]|uniref:hypothetical protein n=1 Tax=Anaerotruncus massiliensis (ex Togo et al. 2019) TaxID=1673720 RepID=UPI003A88F909
TLGSRKESRDKLHREKENLEARLQALRRLAYTLRSDIFTTTDTEASEAIMLKRIEITNRIERLSKLENTITTLTERLRELSREWNTYLDQRGKLPKKDITESDAEKIALLKRILSTISSGIITAVCRVLRGLISLLIHHFFQL